MLSCLLHITLPRHIWATSLPFLSTSCFQRQCCLQPLQQLPKAQIVCGSLPAPLLALLPALCNSLPSSSVTLLLLSAAEMGVEWFVNSGWTDTISSQHSTFLQLVCCFFNLILFIFNRPCSQIYWAEWNCLSSLFCCYRSAGKFIKQ